MVPINFVMSWNHWNSAQLDKEHIVYNKLGYAQVRRARSCKEIWPQISLGRVWQKRYILRYRILSKLIQYVLVIGVDNEYLL